MSSKKNKKIEFFSILLTIVLLVIIMLIQFYNMDNKQRSTTDNQTIQQEHSIPSLERPQHTPEQQTSFEQQPTTEEEQVVHNTDPILEQLQLMSIDEKIGQLFIFGFQGQVYEQETQLQTWINDYHIANFIVFKRNIHTDEQLATLINHIDLQNSSADIPIWVGIDQEGGIVNRLPKKYNSAEQFAKWDDELVTYTKHIEMAKHLIHLGIDINFGPVLDINSNPNNPVINSRAFGNDAEKVKKHTKAVIDAYNDEKLIAVGKHFPGHGDTNDDSHFKLPVIKKSWDELSEVELLPFQYAIANDIPSIMVGHLLIEQVDNTLPASLSPTVIEQLIDGLGFEGIIMTDDLIMDGILKHHSMSEAAVLALNAGVHMIIIGHDVDKQYEALTAVKEAINNEQISIEQLDEKIYTILKYKLNE